MSKLETPDLRTNFNDLTALAHWDLTVKQCELMDNFGIVHGKTADDYINDRDIPIRSRVTPTSNSFGPPFCTVNPHAMGDANIDPNGLCKDPNEPVGKTCIL